MATAEQEMRILVVDDDEEWREIIIDCLKKFFPAAQYIQASSGAEAGEASRGGTFALVTMDGNLGMEDGPEVVATLRAEGTQAPIIMISANADARADGLKKGATKSCDKSNVGKDLPPLLRALDLIA